MKGKKGKKMKIENKRIIGVIKEAISLLYSYLYQFASFLSVRHTSYYLTIFVTYFDTHIEFIYYLSDWI